MRQREDRLRGILELVASGADAGVDERRLIGRVANDYGRAPATAILDLEDLEGRGWILRRFGRVRLTPEGQARSGRPILSDPRQHQVEDQGAKHGPTQ